MNVGALSQNWLTVLSCRTPYNLKDLALEALHDILAVAQTDLLLLALASDSIHGNRALVYRWDIVQTHPSATTFRIAYTWMLYRIYS